MLECEECRGGRRDSAKMSHPTALREGQPVAEKGLLTVEGTNVVAVPAGEATSGLTAGERQLWRGGQGASNLSSTPDSRDVLSSLGDGSLTTPGANAQLSAQVRPASATTSRPAMQVPGSPLQSQTSAPLTIVMSILIDPSRADHKAFVILLG